MPQTLDWLASELAELYDYDSAVAWLAEPQHLLNGQTPCALVSSGREIEVIALIDQLRTGAYV